MKDAAVQKQLNRLAELEARAKEIKSASRDLRSYTRTLAYRDALSGLSLIHISEPTRPY